MSSVPAALTALVTLATTALPGVSVWDGPPLEEAADLLMVGYSGEDDAPAVTVTADPADLGGASCWEDYDVACELSCATGDQALTATRARLFGFFAALKSALAVDQKLGGVVARAYVSQWSLVQALTATGTVVGVRFTVHVQASVPF